MKNKFLKLVWDYKHAAIFLFYIPFGQVFGYLESTLFPVYTMHSVVDDWIPFVPVFVLPYIFWFWYITFTMIYLCLFSKHDFFRLSAHMFTGMCLCLVIFYLFPNAQDLRPNLTGQNEIFARMVRYIYAHDTPTNVNPSIHVYNSLAIHVAVLKSKCFKNRKVLKFLSLALCISICASTVLIKQHSIIDVVAACALSLVVGVFVYGIKFRQKDKAPLQQAQ